MKKGSYKAYYALTLYVDSCMLVIVLHNWFLFLVDVAISSFLFFIVVVFRVSRAST